MKKREYEIQLKEADIEEKMKILAEEKSKFGEKKKKLVAAQKKTRQRRKLRKRSKGKVLQS